MNELTFELLRIAIIVAVAIVVRYFIPWVTDQLEQSEYNQIIKDIYFFVRSVEQTMTDPGSGSAKKAKVLDMIAQSLKTKHFLKLTDAQIDELIEAAVYVLKHPEAAAI